MDLSLFSLLLRNILHVNVLCTQDGFEELTAFEKKFCYNPVLQPAFTAQALNRLRGEMQEKTIYGLQDDLGVCLHFFRFVEHVFFVGPFVRSSFDADRIQNALLSHRFPASFAPSVKLYYNAFPVVSSTHVRNITLACIRSFLGNNEDYAFCRLRDVDQDVSLPAPLRSASLDYSTLHRRYDQENRFLRMIETGDTENVITAYLEITMEGLTENRYVSAIYQDPAVGFAMMRALARKAAERGGASVVDVHEITQRAMQEAVVSDSRNALAASTMKMILELTKAVRKNQTDYGAYSPAIRKVVEHIRLNFSQEISLSELAEMSKLSETYLPKAFKKEVGVPILQYIAYLRCKQAAEMLKGSDTPIQDISSYVGYEDNNYFVKVFKKQYGMTPSEYRAGK